jgi:hypothetical protein
MTPLSPQFLKIDRSTPIVGETEEISDCRNLPFKSRAEFSDGSRRQFFGVSEKDLVR